MKRSLDMELMDVPGQPPEVFEENLRDLALLNRYLRNHANVIGAFEYLIGTRNAKDFSLLDIGTGSADIPLNLASWAAARDVHVRIAALEYASVAAQQARERTRETAAIAVLRGDGAALPFRRNAFDYVLASQLLHHFTEDKIVALLRTWAQIARRAIIVSDLVRHPLAYHGIRLLSCLCTRNVMTRTDAPLSVRRAFTQAEWRQIFHRANVGSFKLRRAFPFRILAIIEVG